MILSCEISLLMDLKKLINTSDGEALDLFEKIKEHVKPIEKNNYILLLEEHLHHFNFDDASIALEHVDQLIKQMLSENILQ